MSTFSDTQAFAGEPPQPAQWRFVEDLQSPMWSDHQWQPREARQGEASLAGGLRIDNDFPDPDHLLATAWDDLHRFLQAGRVSVHDGGYPLRIRHAPMATPESHRIEINAEGCTVTAGDTEGVRRAVFHLEDEMLRAQGPFWPWGVTERWPVVRTRISRCFFGPINRPPANRDELTDDVNYYPDEYLNRLAHDGVNALWLSIKLRDVCPSSFFPEFGQDAVRRQDKLRKTVQRCLRYGIRVYAFGIEPMGFGDSGYLIPMALAQRHPELCGHRAPDYINFCPSSEAGQAYIEEAMHTLFASVPGLGGFISIQLGERPTHCCSAIHQLASNNCPRCASRKPGEVFADLWQAMRRGVDKAAPAAELVSWLYIPVMEDTPDSTVQTKHDMVRQIASHVPQGVTLQLNFESGAIVQQQGQTHPLEDYSLAFTGSSELFAQCAALVTRGGGRISAKIQAGNSHEVATTPYVPVPGNLYEKYKAMHDMGVSTVMQCWYFGNYPSVMTRAAGALSFAPFPESEQAFLTKLASVYHGPHAPRVVQAWHHFQEAYRQFPVNCRFAWFGPVHDSVTWRLHLKPVNQPIAPSWQLGHAPTGDRVGECFGYEHTFDQIVATTQAMASRWQQGVKLLEEVIGQCSHGHGREQLSNAKALGLQFQSAANVMRFYHLREDLPRQPASIQRQMLAQMRSLVEQELQVSAAMIPLAENDPRLGFHSEAEGYKYHPEKLRWRCRWLQQLLQTQFPEVAHAIEQGRPLFPQYTGASPAGKIHPCTTTAHTMETIFTSDDPWRDVPAAECPPYRQNEQLQDSHLWRTTWRALRDEAMLYIRVACLTPADPSDDHINNDMNHHHDDMKKALLPRYVDHLVVRIESRRAGPLHDFYVTSQGVTQYQGRRSGPASPWRAHVQRGSGRWTATTAIPLACLAAGETLRWPMRMNIRRAVPLLAGHVWSWASAVPMPTPGYSVHLPHPEEYGWLTQA